MARISAHAHGLLQDLASRRGQSYQQTLEDALGLLQKQQFFGEAHDAYARLRSDPEGWGALEADRASFDGAAADGLGGE